MKLNSPEILIPISILLVTSGVILGINLNNQNTTTTTAPPAPAEPSAPAVTVNPNFPISPYPTNVAVSFRDPVQVTDAPIQPPLKYNPYGPPPPQIATRGHPGNFQQVGILTGSKPGETGEPLILPL